MDRGAGATQVVVALLLVALSGGTLLFGPPSSAAGPAGPSDAEFETFVERPPGATVEREVEVVAELKPGTSVSDELLARTDVRVQRSDGTRHLRGTVSLSEVRALSDARGVAGVRIETADVDVRDRDAAPGATAIGAARLHDRGVTGANVTVGVIDDDFRLDHPAVAGQVAAYRAFGETGEAAHGTAVASIVADTAPGSQLHLAAVGPTTTPEEYRRAVEWLRASGADVIVDSGSYLGAAESEEIAAVASRAADDVAFVTSAGNYARRHYTAVHDPVDVGAAVLRPGDVEGENRSRAVGTASAWGEAQSAVSLIGGDRADGTAAGWLRFGDDRYNELGDGAVGGRVTVAATWNSSIDYDLYLVRETRAGRVVWTSSTADTDGRERLSVVVPRGRYAVVVGYDGETEAPTRLHLFANRRLGTATPAGSLTAPATAPDVIAVGALADEGDGAAAFSSRGPVDGRAGVTLVAPDSVGLEGAGESRGTSFAAPYVAGTVALLYSAHPDVAVTRVGTVVSESAADVGAAGLDPATGYGRLDALAAARTLDAAEEGARVESGQTGTNVTVPPATPLRSA